MQRRIIALIAAGALSGANALTVDRTSTAASEAVARTWLREHAAPQSDELAGLKTVNPEAYAIVKALLTKRSLGLLDPKHPSASFSAPPQDSNQDAVPSGAVAFEKFASPGELKSKVQPVYPEATTAAHHDWFGWKPSSSAMDDEAMVQNVLGAVAELKGKSSSKNYVSTSQDAQSSNAGSALAADEAAFGSVMTAVPPDAAAPAASEAVSSPVDSPAAGETDDFKDADMSGKPASQTPTTQGTSLRGTNLGSEVSSAPGSLPPAAWVSESAKDDALASISRDNSKQEEPQPQPEIARLVQQQQTTKKQTSNANALMSWLDADASAAPAVPASPAKPAHAQPIQPTSSNPYLVNW